MREMFDDHDEIDFFFPITDRLFRVEKIFRRFFQAAVTNLYKINMFSGELKKACSNIDLDITSEATPEVTGFFEVTVDGKLVHSKKDGDGFPDTKDKMDKIVKAVEEAK
ncbi:unnamed protein product [Rotaria sordida]|uniref:Selenoprotein W n=1 Tax=Rotaria sordida TaxID=392033 RepID=A0A815X464_9BILA|nr:unnamed protein product [Rotaria sordida]CAF1673886.1 unnamed protein product [Rotaria sordida]